MPGIPRGFEHRPSPTNGDGCLRLDAYPVLLLFAYCRKCGPGHDGTGTRTGSPEFVERGVIIPVFLVYYVSSTPDPQPPLTNHEDILWAQTDQCHRYCDRSGISDRGAFHLAIPAHPGCGCRSPAHQPGDRQIPAGTGDGPSIRTECKELPADG